MQTISEEDFIRSIDCCFPCRDQEHGADVGDLFMTLTHTATLNQADPFANLVALLTHAGELAAARAAWMPWNYQERLSGTERGSA